VREEVAHCYGKNGNESVAPEVILKMMFLLFFDDIKSERELMEVIGERLDYLWFLDYGLADGDFRITFVPPILVHFPSFQRPTQTSLYWRPALKASSLLEKFTATSPSTIL